MIGMIGSTRGRSPLSGSLLAALMAVTAAAGMPPVEHFEKLQSELEKSNPQYDSISVVGDAILRNTIEPTGIGMPFDEAVDGLLVSIMVMFSAKGDGDRNKYRNEQATAKLCEYADSALAALASDKELSDRFEKILDIYQSCSGVVEHGFRKKQAEEARAAAAQGTLPLDSDDFVKRTFGGWPNN
jgi:hypothetical protein